ncbi:mitochondrial protein import protein ZIM17 [Humulus lupulus]|uniref:mitochondrial protein import protein ZIM17 n=1 Tax=Humulus lupulus TaxID=3486 RepID=UPI002B40EA16|nr:mitochondrial protein import protein ZIM17 [Humulus lupulus]XP_062110581.1 mitochondrial protein import protein ZIM17 [Humulus lupulus]XP_062110582.1 mitochondrial protein import protein ZIM17 [Humulus lupulus]XP_062110583.1 mitochondrial protein import protein ZIM17 [Humulus lupulus]XP_062110584.1 mitochondrial protein import protein ZIM17 [Humulus lupulus]
MAATTIAWRFSSALHCPSFSTTDSHRPIHSNLCSNTYKPFSSSNIYPSITLSRSSSKTSAPKHAYKSLVISGLVHGNSETHPESESSVSNSDATIDIKLPRRSLLLQFTCDICGERTQKLVNRLAYERGLIYVQCAGCRQYHKLVDNLGLVVEYDLREEIIADMNKDEV